MNNDFSSEVVGDIPFGVDSLSSAWPFPFQLPPDDAIQKDGNDSVQVDNVGFPIPLTPTTSTSSSTYDVADRTQFSTPARANRSQKIRKTPEYLSLEQDRERRGKPARKFFEEEEGGNRTHSKEPRNKRWKAFKTNPAIVSATLMLFVIVISLGVAALFLLRIKADDDTVPLTPAASAPLVTIQPVSSPSLRPTQRVTLPFTSQPTRATPSPVASLEEPIRAFLLQDNGGVNVDPTNQMVQKATEWLVEEANEAGSLVSPLGPKYLQRFGILILYYSVNPNVDAAISGRVHLPSSLMRDQDECSWRGIKCDDSGMVANIKLQNLGLDGALPSEWGFFPNLKSIDLSKNQLVGQIPEGMYDILGLEEIHLYKNQLGGTISPKIGNLWELQRFHLSHNRISGSIPPEIASTSSRVRKLYSFNMHRNQMTGSIPSNMRLRQLFFMDLGRNQFSGTLPPDFGTESVRLRHLYIDYNAFVGPFPTEVLNAGDGRLKSLFLNNNQFNGTFPGDHDKSNSLLVELTLQNNNFDALQGSLCHLHSLSSGKIVEFKIDCNICHCSFTLLCKSCWQ